MVYNSLLEVIESAKKSPNGITFISGKDKEKYLSYNELFLEACKILRVLQLGGIKPGFELVFQIEDNEKFISVFWACILGKIIPVPITVANKDEYRLKLLKVWKILNNPFLITDKKIFLSIEKYVFKNHSTEEYEAIKHNTIFLEEMKENERSGQLMQSSLDDIAFIQFSSGSTGDPKGVVLTHKNLLTNINAIINCAKLTAGDRALSWMPLTHDMGLIGFHLTTTMLKINQYIIPTTLFIRRPNLWMHKVNQYRISLTSSPNFGYKYFLSYFKPESAEEWDLSCVRLIFNGAEPISIELCEEFLNKMECYKLNKKSIFNVYGLAEASLAVTFPSVNEEMASIHVLRSSLSVGDKVIEGEGNGSIRLADLGSPVTDCSVRICNDNNEILPDKTLGNIQIKGDNVTERYYNNEEATSRLILKDGWLDTGDLGFMENNRLIVTGRAKDIIFVNGQNYYPHDIEKASEGVEGIELGKIALCGVFDNKFQRDVILAFIMFKKKIEEFMPLALELKRYISYNRGVNLDFIIPVKHIPKTTSGKIQRYKLGDMYFQGKYNDVLKEMEYLKEKLCKHKVYENPTTEIEKTLVSICREFLPVSSIGINDNFFDIGASSIILNQITHRLESIYPGKISVTDLFAYPTIAKLAAFLQKGQAITLPTLKIPEEFINKNRDIISSPVMFQFKLYQEQYKSVQDLCRNKNISVEDFITSLYIFMLSKVSKEPLVSIQLMTHKEDMVYSGSYNISKMKQFSHLSPDKISEGGFWYSINDVDQVRLERDKSSYAILLYNREFMSCNIDLINIYDILMEITMKDDEVEFFCEYNNLKLSAYGISKLMNDYANSILSNI
ncbi:non-ribosomal peptide synthetase [Clostridium kluyveri]|uniref:Peptide synthetase n=1 Tax=Clostridium kluyveri TaxID=1534 RepID=A0A1L5F9C9_CLOKL|nr:non-ribosomal peptide synthetase [Clostridium kluyveri]APM39628.1 peptide synthetase [Clostridium kluyveri]UZQ50218.1 non-ribosomal peptide synthetase [Clostridium kluyveri]